MMTTQTIIGDIWITEGRFVGCNLHMVLLDDSGAQQMKSNPHTITMAPDADIAAMFTAINTDITTREGLMWPALPQAEIDRFTAHTQIEFTPAVKAAYAQFKAQQAARDAIIAVQLQP